MLKKIVDPAARAVARAKEKLDRFRGTDSTKSQSSVKYRLSAVQVGSVVEFTTDLSATVELTGIWLRESDGAWVPAPLTTAGLTSISAGDDREGHHRAVGESQTRYQFAIDLRTIDLSAFAEREQVSEGLKLLVYLELDGPSSTIPESAQKWADLVLPDGGSRSRYGDPSRTRGLTALGRFELSSLKPFTAVANDSNTLTAYITQKGNVSIAVNLELRPYMRVHIDSIDASDSSGFNLAGRLYTRSTRFENPRLKLVARITETSISAPIDLTFDAATTMQNFGLRKYYYSATVQFSEFLGIENVDEVFDVWIEAEVVGTGETHRSRVGKNRYLVRRNAKPGFSFSGDQAVSVVPYFTMKAKNLSLQVEFSDTNALEAINEAIAHPVRARRNARSGRDGRPIWLIGEMPFKAQDTGLSFFKYVIDHHPEVEAYYVLRPDSPELINLEGYQDYIVDYRSAEHVRLALAAERIIGSHHATYVYPTMRRAFTNSCTALEVFLQHGVMGMKWMPPTYGKSTHGFSTDLFITSSEREKRMIVEDFGYSPSEVVVTGLSRFDSLFEDDVELNERQVLILPTWRDWLSSEEVVTQSRFFEEWHSFLSSPQFLRLCEQHNLEIVFGLHPNMRQYIHLFNDTPVRTFVQGEVNVQTLIKQSAVMITDYSSAGLDFSFLHKPLIYFQFDREKFFNRSRSHFDLDNELPGPVHFTAPSVLSTLDRCFSVSPTEVSTEFADYYERADRLYPYRDRNNRERIFQAVSSATRQRTIGNLTHSEQAQLVTKRVRNSKYYHPSMRRMFNLARQLPVDNNLIVFESGVGKQYADSPRAIYEELVRRGDTRTKVWVYNKVPPVSDEHTIIIKRFSPQYFWYLGRAKYWVNNQNFPHYFTRRKEGVYVQTWHGTPLKKMQHDLDHIEGRTAGYLERVTASAQQWSHLLSPSPYATSAFATAFKHRAEVVETGYPRNDALFATAEVSETIRRRLDIPADKQVLMYAPTFRDDQTTSANRFTFKLPFDIERFASELGDNYILLLRMHGVVSNRLAIPPELGHVVRDVSSHDDINDLYLISDALITDYSSVFFDFSIMQRPIIFFAPDLANYRDKLRGFYLDYEEEVPGPVVQTEEELWETVSSLPELSKELSRRSAEFAGRYAPYDDGHAAQRVVDQIFRPTTDSTSTS